jgi:predicted transcriptional regulator
MSRPIKQIPHPGKKTKTQLTRDLLSRALVHVYAVNLKWCTKFDKLHQELQDKGLIIAKRHVGPKPGNKAMTCIHITEKGISWLKSRSQEHL